MVPTLDGVTGGRSEESAALEDEAKERWRWRRRRRRAMAMAMAMAEGFELQFVFVAKKWHIVRFSKF
jgi:hypothetical protein